VALAGKRTLEQQLLAAVDAGLAGAIFLVPLLMGGRHAVGQLVLTVLAVGAAWAWSVRQMLGSSQPWRPVTALPWFMAGAALLVLQIIPLPHWLLTRLHPQAAELLPLWQPIGQTPAALGCWPCFSFAPSETLAGLMLFIDYALLFLIAVQRLHNVEDIERLLRWCAGAVVIVAAFGVVQFFAGNGKFFWFYEHPFTNTKDAVKGSFSNRNHFAHFLALGIGPLIWWLHSILRQPSRSRPAAKARPTIAAGSFAGPNQWDNLTPYFLWLGLGIVFFAVLFSLSRGGIIAFLSAAAVGTLLCHRVAPLSHRFLGVLFAAGAILVVSLILAGHERISRRLEDISSGSLERLDRAAARRTVWANTLEAVKAFPILGSGVGSFREVYPLFGQSLENETTEFTHAENSYLQVALETGLVGVGLMSAAIVLCGYWCLCGLIFRRSHRVRLCAAALTASLVASLCHALVDFVWYVPACTAFVSLLAACALRTAHSDEKETIKQPSQLAAENSVQGYLQRKGFSFSPAWATAVGVLSVAGCWMVYEQFGMAAAQTYWERCLVDGREEATDPPSENEVESKIAVLDKRLKWLTTAVRWSPVHFSAYLKLAQIHRELFELHQSVSENAIPLSHLADAISRQPFATRAALMEWLERACGPHWRHLQYSLEAAHRALRLCPLEGRAYVYLADLAFLWGGSPKASQACIAQALRVRPHDGVVLYAAARQAALIGDTTGWLEFARRAFQTGRQTQRQVIGDLVAATLPENLPSLCESIIQEFQPDLPALRTLSAACANRCPTEQLTLLHSRRAELAFAEAQNQHGEAAARFWLEAQEAYAALGRNEEALDCLQKALQCDPNNYAAHYRLGISLLQLGRYAQAETHLRWCLQRTPYNSTIERKLREALKGRLQSQWMR